MKKLLNNPQVLLKGCKIGLGGFTSGILAMIVVIICNGGHDDIMPMWLRIWIASAGFWNCLMLILLFRLNIIEDRKELKRIYEEIRKNKKK